MRRVLAAVGTVPQRWRSLSRMTRTAIVLCAAGVTGTGLLALTVFYIPPRYLDTSGMTKPDRLKAENDLRTTLVQALGGAVVLIGVYFTWRRLSAAERSNEIAREGQITERFTRAIDQLGEPGDDKLDVRLGGIYALERIAIESDKDHGPIMEVLTAFLREHARWQPGSADPMSTEAPPLASFWDAPSRPRADFQAVATVLGRRADERRRTEERALDLRRVNLRFADLRDAYLEWAELRGAHLEGANLRRAHLEGAYLRDAHLEWATLREAHVERAYLTEAHLERANLRQAHLKGAYLGGAHLQRADLRGADLGGADLRGADLEGADLEGADLGGARLEGAILGTTDVSGARGLTAAQLRSTVTDDVTMLPTLEQDGPGHASEPTS
jgi:uncharacterized protein YjbI with pentapeptide repeats